MTRRRLVLVGEDPLALAGLAALLAGQGAEVAAQAGPGGDLSALVAEHAPDAVVWDAGPRGSAVRVKEIGVPVLALLGAAEAPDDALAAGARGLLFRDAPPETMAAAIEALVRGLVVLDEPLARPWRGRPAPARELVEPLTPREGEVLQLLAQGLPNRLIAGRLGISEHTAKFHVNAILGKLGAATRTEAVAQAVRLGLVLL